jgi:hypothetical protein
MDNISVDEEPGQHHAVASKVKADHDTMELAMITGYKQQMVRRWGLQKVIGMGRAAIVTIITAESVDYSLSLRRPYYAN